MPRQEHVITVFVASPSDVSDERSKLEDVIRELNITWSRSLGIRLDLDKVPVLSEERTAYWERVSNASFLSDEEKRALLGFGENGGGRDA